MAPGSLEQKDFQETTPKDNSQDLIIHGSLAVRRGKKVYLLMEFLYKAVFKELFFF